MIIGDEQRHDAEFLRDADQEGGQHEHDAPVVIFLPACCHGHQQIPQNLDGEHSDDELGAESPVFGEPECFSCDEHDGSVVKKHPGHCDSEMLVVGVVHHDDGQHVQKSRSDDGPFMGDYDIIFN